MTAIEWDVVIVGGGPAGSVCAARLATSGRRVLLLDQAVFPRDHVGESLSPAAWQIFEALGLGEALRTAQFAPKTGATFVWGAGNEPWSVGYGAPDGPPQTAHVRREELDHLLLEHAEKCGVTVRQGCHATTIGFEGERLREIDFVDEHGGPQTVTAHWFVDASGREAFLGHRLALLELEPRLQHHVAWSRWRDVQSAGGARGQSLLIGEGELCYWSFPLDADGGTTSIGVVRREPARRGETSGQFYRRSLASSKRLSEALENAYPVREVSSTEAVAYCCSRTAGQGWLLVGEAAWFADSLLTPGVQVAVQQGIVAATVIDTLLDGDQHEAKALALYDLECRRTYQTFVRLALNMYGALDSGWSADDTTPQAPGLAGAMNFLTLISGLTRPELAAAMGKHMMARGKALGRAGSAPGPQEQEGFGLLTRRFHEEALAAARDGRIDTDLGDDSVIRTSPGVAMGEELFLPKAGGAALTVRRAVTNRFGDRFEATPELEAVLTLTREGCDLRRLASEVGTAAGLEPDQELNGFRAWLRILADNGLIEWQR